MNSWLLQNIVGIIGIFVGVFIGYHIYFLSKKLDLRDKLAHKDLIKAKIEPLLHKIANGLNSEVEMINSKKYEKHYPNNNRMNKDGYTYLKAELKALRFDGVEFFCEMAKEAYQHSDGSFYFKKEKPNDAEVFRVFTVGLVPYEWIVHIDERGDEYGWKPQFFIKFIGKKKYPYKRMSYYTQSETYHEKSDPMDWKYKQVEIVK